MSNYGIRLVDAWKLFGQGAWTTGVLLLVAKGDILRIEVGMG